MVDNRPKAPGVVIDFDLAERIMRTKSAREAFECSRQFWDISFKKAERPFLGKCFGNWTIA
jgi:hypothetical protein